MAWLAVYVLVNLVGVFIVFAMFKVGGDADVMSHVCRSSDHEDSQRTVPFLLAGFGIPPEPTG
jgi:hypothetical protein